MRRAVRDFLAAARVPDDPELARSDERVVDAWVDEFLSGYRKDPFQALGNPSAIETGSAGTVFLTHIDYTGVCPHHLLPYRGVAHVAYVPKAKLAGFSRIAALIDSLSHRLTLQETLARQIADTLVEGLDALGAGVILDAEQLCMSARGVRRASSRALVEAASGNFAPEDFARLWAAAKDR